jgi:hypothetical protein
MNVHRSRGRGGRSYRVSVEKPKTPPTPPTPPVVISEKTVPIKYFYPSFLPKIKSTCKQKEVNLIVPKRTWPH